MITETEYLSRNAEWMQLDREFQQKFLRHQQAKRKPGLFRNWLIYGLTLMFCGGVWGALILGTMKLWSWIR